MPKTPIDENGDLEAGECNVGDASRLQQHHVIDAVTQPEPEEFPAQRNFRIRVLLAHPRHATAGVCRGWGYARHSIRSPKPSLRRQRLKMPRDALRDGAAEFDGDGVADQSPEGGKADFAFPGNELIGARKALEDGSLPQRNGTVLFRMPESAISEPIALRCHRGRRFIPFHAPIHPRIGSAGICLVAIGDQVFGPVPPCSSGARVNDALKVFLGQGCRRVQFVPRRRLAGSEGFQPADRLTYRLRRLLCRRDHLDVPMSRCQQHHPSAHLRHPILGAIHHLEPHLVFEASQRIDEIVKDLMLRYSRHILHGNNVRLGVFSEAGKMV
ncbi:hypothetical protein LHGZ1_0354 [Laribacter hongkongensis]|uniref:Uncharacterized protein n=1 Tax=Laribacter hongkongensis TaxID=168471 RepID=A0A248LFE4_9NEIS|nr:hypothetical protein LHGZ1_0354 [Laribacter hongkongensis]